MGIQIYSNKGAGPFWGPISVAKQDMDIFDNSSKSSQEALAGMH